MTLTTRDPETASESFRRGVEAVFNRKTGLRRWWDVEYFGKVEFTTGRRARDRARRMHAHFLLKGLAGADVLNVERIARERWRTVTGAFVVEVAELRTPSAALNYLGLHHSKASQLPPPEWRGMVERASRGYWSEPIADLRDRARRELWAEALAWSSGATVEDCRLLVDGTIAERQRERAAMKAASEAARSIAAAAVTEERPEAQPDALRLPL